MGSWVRNARKLPADRDESPRVGRVKHWKELYLDTIVNEVVLRHEIHRMLSKAVACSPGKITKEIYRSILHTDLDDPYLGLGRDIFGSYPFEQ